MSEQAMNARPKPVMLSGGRMLYPGRGHSPVRIRIIDQRFDDKDQVARNCFTGEPAINGGAVLWFDDTNQDSSQHGYRVLSPGMTVEVPFHVGYALLRDHPLIVETEDKHRERERRRRAMAAEQALLIEQDLIEQGLPSAILRETATRWGQEDLLDQVIGEEIVSLKTQGVAKNADVVSMAIRNVTARQRLNQESQHDLC